MFVVKWVLMLVVLLVLQVVVVVVMLRVTLLTMTGSFVGDSTDSEVGGGEAANNIFWCWFVINQRGPSLQYTGLI